MTWTRLRRQWGLFLMLATGGSLPGAVLVHDGQPMAEIVIATHPAPSAKVAAQELQKVLRRMSGAELPIVTQPTGKTPVYVGASAHTEKLGITLDDVKNDGFKIIVTDDFVVLLGRDQHRLPIPRNNTRFGLYEQMNKEWETHTGHPWEYPRIARDPRQFNPELGFCCYDATGTLYAMYDFLESLGMRWFMPVEGIGEVIPELRTIRLAATVLKKEPRLASRGMYYLLGSYRAEMLWYKYLKQGGMFDQWPAHSSMAITKMQQDRSDLLAYAAGKPIFCGPERILPRLASEQLRKELTEYLVKVADAFPEMPYLPIGQPDGWVAMDDRDVAAGWDRKEEGDWGRYSDYTWDFVLDVANQVRAQRPNARFNTMSYGRAKKPPQRIESIPPEIAIYFTQNSSLWHLPSMQDERALREEWLRKAPGSEFFIYDYYRYHSPESQSPPVPVIFTALMQQNFAGLDARFRGIYTEVTASMVRNLPGIDHLMLYLHGKFTWDPELDLQATLKDYYEKFYGPAAVEMREFFEYAESIWMRPEPRQVTAVAGFLKPADVPRYFEILERARAKAGDSVYGQRIDLIAGEIVPLKKLFGELKRTGPYVRVRRMDVAPPIDGDLSKPFWTENHAREKVMLRDCVTGVAPDSNPTSVAFRWLPDSSLLLGIACHERRMDSLQAQTPESGRDEMDVYRDDNVEVHLETPDGYRAVIVVNPNGAVRDTCVTPNLADVPLAWNAEQVAVRKLPDRWTLEIRVKGIGDMPTKSYPWGVNVFRQRMAGGDFEGYALSPTGGGFQKAPAKMGNLYGP